jgi:uncharacterized membrane protein
MRTTRAIHAALLLGLGLGAFFEGILLHPVAGFLYMAIWAATLGGVVLLWSTVRGPGPLPSGRVFVGSFVIGWGLFNMVDAIARHDLRDEWLIFGVGLGFALLGGILLWTRPEPHLIERRSGQDRRSGSPVR